MVNLINQEDVVLWTFFSGAVVGCTATLALQYALGYLANAPWCRHRQRSGCAWGRSERSTNDDRAYSVPSLACFRSGDAGFTDDESGCELFNVSFTRQCRSNEAGSCFRPDSAAPDILVGETTFDEVARQSLLRQYDAPPFPRPVLCHSFLSGGEVEQEAERVYEDMEQVHQNYQEITEARAAKSPSGATEPGHVYLDMSKFAGVQEPSGVGISTFGRDETKEEGEIIYENMNEALTKEHLGSACEVPSIV